MIRRRAATAFLVEWLGVNTPAFMNDWGTFELARTPFIATFVGSLLAGALLYNLPTGVALRRLTVHRDP